MKAMKTLLEMEGDGILEELLNCFLKKYYLRNKNMFRVSMF